MEDEASCFHGILLFLLLFTKVIFYKNKFSVIVYSRVNNCWNPEGKLEIKDKIK